MAADVVVDASVAAKVYFDEGDIDLADEALAVSGRLIAPDLIFAEIASIAAKRVRRGTSDAPAGLRAVRGLAALFDETVPIAALRERAYELAAQHGFSAYDGVYLALAEDRALKLLTADAKLVGRAREAGFSDFVSLLGE